MTRNLGFYNTATSRTHVRFQFTTSAAAGGAVAPSSAFEAADLRIYKAADGAAFSATQRSSAAGITMTSPFDSVTGLHDVDIDLTDNTDAGFYAAGGRYSVVLVPDETVDSQTVVAVLAEFEIGRYQTDVREFGGTAGTFASGRPEVNTSHIAGSAVSTSTAQIGVNVVNFGGSAGTFSSGRPEVNASHFSGSSTAADNAEVVFATDFATNYNTTRDKWQVESDVLSISGDSTAADNLELALDDTEGAVPWFGIVDQGTAQSASATGVVLRSAAAFADDTLIGCVIGVFGSTQGYWQFREITDNALSGDTVTVDTWTVTPSGTITYKIFGCPPALTTLPNVNVTQISGDSTAADNLESYLDGSEFMPVDAFKQNFSVSGTTLTAKKPDETTTAYTKTLNTVADASADDITGSTLD